MVLQKRVTALPAPGYFDPNAVQHTLMWQACNEVCAARQISMEMAVPTLLGAMAIVSQGLYDVRVPYGTISPLSLYILVVGSSGIGKSNAMNVIMGPIKKLQQEMLLDHKNKMQQYEIDLEEWQMKHDAYKQKVRSAISKNSGPATKLTDIVREHYKVKPKRPKAFKIIYEDSTPAAFFNGLHENIQAASYMTDEGEIFYKSGMAQSRANLNKLMSGEPTIIDRITRPDIYIPEPRGSAFIMIQPEVLQHHLTPRDRDSGFLARFIVVNPPIVQGTRQFTPYGPKLDKLWAQAEARIKFLAEQNLDLLINPDRKRDVLEFTPEAITLWYQLINEIEQQMLPGGRFFDCHDHASKLSDIIARVAALIHLFEQYEGDISASTLAAAIEFCGPLSDHFRQILIPPSQEVLDAQRLLEWINEQRSYNIRGVSHNHIRQYGPGELRNKQRLRDAINILVDKNEIRLYMDGKTKMVDMMPYWAPFNQ